jgi:plastocyanin
MYVAHCHSSPALTVLQIDVAFDSTFTFHPANITAPNGTIVTFFFPKYVYVSVSLGPGSQISFSAGISHSVTQSSFGAPCTYLAANGSKPGGFDSGLTAGTQFSINITNDAAPIWFHCKQVLHCGMGMVGWVL